ncbi:lipoprotein [gut metagenome]|uniref:Lipoprotein n=1 Tax=gut metagenome TaxID=749906 RepID=J9CJ37_9ZZZZ
MKNISISMLLSAAFMLTACNNANKNETNNNLSDAKPTVTNEHAPTYCGVYTGTLPCADCSGIQTTLQINEDTTYGLTSVYLDEKDGTFEYNGVYKMPNDSLIMLITPSSNEKTYYRIIDDQSIMLSDSLGTINQGELAEHYILKKK